MEKENLYKVAMANSVNPYADILPFAMQIGYPEVNYFGVALKKEEVILYVVPAKVYNDKNKVVGYKGGSAGISVRVAKGVSLRTGSSRGRAIRSNVREYTDGDLVITNKRLIFVSESKGFDISISKISVAKILTKQTFLIQAGNTTKNIFVDEAVIAYTLALVDHAVSSYLNNKDLYKNYHLVQDNITAE